MISFSTFIADTMVEVAYSRDEKSRIAIHSIIAKGEEGGDRPIARSKHLYDALVAIINYTHKEEAGDNERDSNEVRERSRDTAGDRGQSFPFGINEQKEAPQAEAVAAL